MPPEVLPDAFLCDSNCSKGKEDDINVLSWYTHVLPQLRDRSAPQRHYHCEVSAFDALIAFAIQVTL